MCVCVWWSGECEGYTHALPPLLYRLRLPTQRRTYRKSLQLHRRQPMMSYHDNVCCSRQYYPLVGCTSVEGTYLNSTLPLPSSLPNTAAHTHTHTHRDLVKNTYISAETHNCCVKDSRRAEASITVNATGHALFENNVTSQQRTAQGNDT